MAYFVVDLVRVTHNIPQLSTVITYAVPSRSPPLSRLYPTHNHTNTAGVLVANKTDLRESGRAVVEEKEGRALAKTLGLAYFETSAVCVFTE